MSIQDKIRDQVTSNRIVLYMKGTPDFPQCGFSATTVEILRRCGVTDYEAVDVLQDPEIRQGIKDYANWPTIPAALPERRIRRRLRHPERDVPDGRAAAAPRETAGLNPRPRARVSVAGRTR
jgi:monothiol glutaredoxin